jgi:hypothetical protein
MKEDLLHFIWQSKTLMKQPLKTTNGQHILIVNPGTLNTDAGPDFFNAKVKIDDTLWAGNIEIHINSSDWKNHKHQSDKKYNNVILHVVYHHDAEVFYDNGTPIPTLEIKNSIPPLILRKYQQLQLQQNTIACEKILVLPSSLNLTNWLERLLIERLQDKCEFFESLLTQNNNHWDESFYTITARYFGMKTNAQPFEWLAQNLPLSVLAKHKNSLIQVEALVFGVAGFLEDDYKNPYINLMKREFDFLRTKYNLKPIDKSVWKFSKTRPANFPSVRLAQFASLIYQSSHLLSKVLDAKNIQELIKLYAINPNKKLNPFLFITHQTKAKQTTIGKSSIELLLINTVLPVLFLYGKRNDKEELSERALNFYEDIKSENNAISRFWQSLGIEVKSSFESQALIQLKNKYCNELKCLSCNIGKEILLNNNA